MIAAPRLVRPMSGRSRSQRRLPCTQRVFRGARAFIAFATIATLLGSGVALAASASAQSRTPVVGTADFRNPPKLVPGRYVDTIVTGDTVWYAVIYRNDQPYSFDVSLDDVDVTANDELTLVTSFVGPSLESVAESTSTLSGDGATYQGGHTNVWYITVTLETTGTLDVEHRLFLDIEGVESTGLEDCFRMSDCTFDTELATLDTQLAEVQAELDVVSGPDPLPIVERDIASLRGSLESAQTLLPGAEARLARAEAKVAQLCAPEPTCDTFPNPGSKTSSVGWLLGLAILGAGVTRLVIKMRAPSDEPAATDSSKPSKAAKKTKETKEKKADKIKK